MNFALGSFGQLELLVRRQNYYFRKNNNKPHINTIPSQRKIRERNFLFNLLRGSISRFAIEGKRTKQHCNCDKKRCSDYPYPYSKIRTNTLRHNYSIK